jgi:hypothetical protein
MHLGHLTLFTTILMHDTINLSENSWGYHSSQRAPVSVPINYLDMPQIFGFVILLLRC